MVDYMKLYDKVLEEKIVLKREIERLKKENEQFWGFIKSCELVNEYKLFQKAISEVE